MFGIESVTGPTGAAMIIGVVLLEAILLYIGYGVLESLFGPAITSALRGD